ncbi:MAG: DUF3520 domain-containing protein [bacterium]|nr:DUF3520 domain-containing protein [bacterium]
MKSAKLTIALTVGLLLAVSSLLAGTGQSGTITGSVTDAVTGDPVAGAWVAVLETNDGAETDSLGFFTILVDEPGAYTLIVTHAEYGTVRGLAKMRVKVAKGATATADLRLQSADKDDLLRGLPQVADVTANEPLSEVGKTKLLDAARLQRREKETAESISRSDRKGDLETSSGGRCGTPLPPALPKPGYTIDIEEEDYLPGYGSLPPFDMFFKDYGTNRFVETRRDRFSTFAVDVDDASYTLIRRYLREGNLPPEEAVRIEEFINHFDYGYNNPSNDIFRVFTELTDSPFDDNLTILKVGVKGREGHRTERRPLRLTLVVDVSGSMGYDNRMELVKRSLNVLVGQLRSTDQVGIVAYGSQAYTILDPVQAHQTGRIGRALNSLHPGGSTFAEAGLRLGYEMANRQYTTGSDNVIMLCSDGVANVGRTSPDAIMTEIDRFARKGISLSTLGFGMGNYNDVLLEQLAQKGNGRYAYINSDEEARKALAQDFLSNTQMLARDVKIQVAFDPKVVKAYRLIGYENRDVADHRFRDNRQDGGEVGAGHEITALYELVMSGQKRKNDIATVHVRWKTSDERRVSETDHKVNLRRDHQNLDRSRPELRLAVVAGRFAEMLKGTAYTNETSYRDLLRLAEPLQAELPSEETDELIELIRLAQGLSSYHTDWREDVPYGYNSNYKR